jgi:hypothetical protein
MSEYAPRKFSNVVTLERGKKMNVEWKSYPPAKKPPDRQIRSITRDTERFIAAHASLGRDFEGQFKKPMESVKFALLSIFKEQSEETNMIYRAVKFLAHHDSKGTRPKEARDAVDAVLVALSFGED